MKATARRLAKAAAVFAALGDPTRLAVVARLASEGPLPVVRLTERAEVSRQAGRIAVARDGTVTHASNDLASAVDHQRTDGLAIGFPFRVDE